MKKVYHLLSVALLGAMALTSCEEDKIVNENNGEGNETDKNLTDYSFIASIKQSAPLGRSNLQNGVYTCCLLYTSPSPRDAHESRMPSSA